MQPPFSSFCACSGALAHVPICPQIPDAQGCVCARVGAFACVCGWAGGRTCVWGTLHSRHHRALELAAAGGNGREGAAGRADADATGEAIAQAQLALDMQLVLDITTPRDSWWNPFSSS